MCKEDTKESQLTRAELRADRVNRKKMKRQRTKKRRRMKRAKESLRREEELEVWKKRMKGRMMIRRLTGSGWGAGRGGRGLYEAEKN